MTRRLHPTNRKDWRLWLKDNHLNEKAVWLIYYKKHTGKRRIPYDHAVEEALCFGWIDSIVKRIDDATYMQKFTPRKKKSKWSALNKKRVAKLIRSGKMRKAGLEKIEVAKINGTWDEINTSARVVEIPVEFEEALHPNKEARDFFVSLSPSYRNQYTGWIASAKKEVTRQRRVKEVMRLLGAKQKLGMK